jgi:hypothetical protein
MHVDEGGGQRHGRLYGSAVDRSPLAPRLATKTPLRPRDRDEATSLSIYGRSLVQQSTNAATCGRIRR